jgi:hypothetical protein
MQNEKQMKDMVWLRSNNGFLVEMANNYFESVWSNAVELLVGKAPSRGLPLLRHKF